MSIKHNPRGKMTEISNYGVIHVVFIVIFLFSRPHKELHEYILIYWFIFLVLPLLSRTFEADLWDVPFPLFKMHLMYPLTFGPFLWLYIKSLLGDLKHLDKKHFYHFLPFISVSLYQLIFAVQFTTAGERQESSLSLFDQLVMLMNFASITYYSVISTLRLRKHGIQVLSHFSELSIQITLKWLYWIIAWFAGTYYVATLIPFQLNLLTHSFFLTIFVFMLSFFSLKQTSIFQDMAFATADIEKRKAIVITTKNDQSSIQNAEEKQQNTMIRETNSSTAENTIKEVKKAKYERSGLTIERASKYLQKLEQYMQNEKPYLDADLTIEKLSKRISIPRHYLTQVISEQLNKNFYLFINEYRINTVKTLIDAPENDSMNMLDIACKSGFNSKSTFNVAFKKLTNMTPSQYKKQKRK